MPTEKQLSEAEILDETRLWVDRFVIGLGLCPFAGPVAKENRIRFALSAAADKDQLFRDFLEEVSQLLDADPAEIETTVLVHPFVLDDFLDYLDFADFLNEKFFEAGLEGVLQVATFHPQYQFAGPAADDPSHATNRSPYPMLHILREESVTAALDHYPDPESIPERNQAMMQKMGWEGINAHLEGK